MGLTNYTFNFPTKVRYGKGISSEVGEEAKLLGATKILIVADKGVIAAGVVKPVEESLKKAGIPFVYHDNLNSNPRIWQAEEGYEFAKKEGVDCIVAVGGGTSMDCAKTIGVLLTHGGKVMDWVGVGNLKTRITPLICVPTTAGTGSEVTPDAVIMDTEVRFKYDIFDAKIAPWVAMIDPEVLYGVPEKILASTGVDALTHAIEAYTCKQASAHTDAFALYAIEVISKNIRKAVLDKDHDAMDLMMLGSTTAGIAFGYSDVAADHCLAQALGGFYDVAHGVACAVFLPCVTKFNIPSCIERYANIAKHMGLDVHGKSTEEAAYMVVDAIRELCADLHIPKLKELDKVDPKDFRDLAQASFDCVSTPSNPRDITVDDFYALLEEAYNE
ncbi:MAG: iron-containing alcohol dehydrogenase [Lachnospiraceae bacterium]|nr:iron-containing alcohol dehydrogenase [Lachnospiraceae bacterium]